MRDLKSEFSGFSKCDNDVITCRDVRNLSGNLNLLAGAKSYPYMPKIAIGNRPVSSINSEHTNKYIYISDRPGPGSARDSEISAGI